ncbi:hypothetical protein [Paenibacillus sp. FSL M7-1046]|uniref:hypothetical protein n=1 Tax=Paenibacillus sp. FSL M7-1046 TaxID=2975315 RepID=UPI0030FCC9E7
MINLPHGITMQDYLFNMDIHILLNKIDRFRKLNIKKLSPGEISKEISNVLMFDRRSVLLSYIDNFKTGTLVYRIRKLKNSEIPNNELNIIQDLWNPPSKFVKRMRLNKPHESLLYACFGIDTALEETKVNDNDSFALIAYEVIDDIKAVRIGNDDDFSSYSSDDRLKLRIINNFLKEEFIREAGEGNEHLYRVSEIIAKDYFDLPPRDVQDAWSYPSVANKPSINICFRPDIAKEKLKVLNVQIVNGYKRTSTDLSLNIIGNIKVVNEKLIYF